jgi:hypothetical protein
MLVTGRPRKNRRTGRVFRKKLKGTQVSVL